MRYDYTFLCECGWESSPFRTLKECRSEARAHANKTAFMGWKCGIKNPTIFIDQYDHGKDGGEMSGRFWKMKF